MAIGGVSDSSFQPEDSFNIPDKKEAVDQKGSHKGVPVSKSQISEGGSPLSQAKEKKSAQQMIEDQRKKPLPPLPERNSQQAKVGLRTKPRPQLQRPNHPAPLPPKDTAPREGGIALRPHDGEGASGAGSAQRGAGLEAAMATLYSYQMGVDVGKTIDDNVAMLAKADTPEDAQSAKERIDYNKDQLDGIVKMITKKRNEAPEGSEERSKLDQEVSVLSAKLEQTKGLIESGYDIKASGFEISQSAEGKHKVVDSAKDLLKDLQGALKKAGDTSRSAFNGAITSLKDFIKDDILSFNNLTKLSDLFDKLETLKDKIADSPFALARKIDAFIDSFSSTAVLGNEVLGNDNIPMNFQDVIRQAHIDIDITVSNPSSNKVAHEHLNERFLSKFEEIKDLPVHEQKEKMDAFMVQEYKIHWPPRLYAEGTNFGPAPEPLLLSVESNSIMDIQNSAHQAIDANLVGPSKALAREDFNEAFATARNELNYLPEDRREIALQDFSKNWLQNNLGIVE